MNLSHIFKVVACILVFSVQGATAQDLLKPTAPTCSQLYADCQNRSLNLDQHRNDSDYVSKGLSTCKQARQQCKTENNKLLDDVLLHQLNFRNAISKINKNESSSQRQ